ncbi:hypothetical protein [Streptomyces clavuligerus]
MRYGAGAGTPAEPRRAAGPEHGGAVVRRHSLRRDPWDDPPHPADHGSDFDTEVWGTEVWGTDGFGVDGPGPEVPWADGFGRPDPWPAPGRVEFPGPWDDPVPPDGPVFPGGAVPPDGPPGTPPAARPTLNGLPSPPGPRDGSTAPAARSAPGSSHDSTRGDDPAADPVRGTDGDPPDGLAERDPEGPSGKTAENRPGGGGRSTGFPGTEPPEPAGGECPDPADPRRPHDAGLRLSALAQLARCAPHALPADVVPGVVGLLRELRAEPAGPYPDGPRAAPPPGASGPPEARPAGARPVPAGSPAPEQPWERESDDTGRHALWTGDLLRTLHSGLGDRVAERTALLTDQLCSPDPGQRIDGVRMSSALLRTRRGEYAELVTLIGEQLADKEPRLADAAAAALGELFGLAAPAADALADFVAADPGCWVQEWASGPRTLGGAVAALARTGDARAVPVLARILELPQAPHDLGYVLDHLGPAAAPLVPALRARLAETELDDRLYDAAGPLLYGLTALRAGEALPEVLRVLRGAPEYRGEWVVELVLGALTSFGPAAREAAPDLRGLLARSARTGGHTGAFAVKAAAALWAVEREAGAVLPLLRTTLASDTGARRAAAGVLGSMGPVAREAVPELRLALDSSDPGTRVDAALALWRVTGDAEPGWPALRTAWEALPFTRVPTAERLAERPDPAGGPVAGRTEGAERLLRAELGRVRRHNAMDGGYGGHDIVRDEKLLALCRRALTGGTGTTGERPTP